MPVGDARRSPRNEHDAQGRNSNVCCNVYVDEGTLAIANRNRSGCARGDNALDAIVRYSAIPPIVERGVTGVTADLHSVALVTERRRPSIRHEATPKWIAIKIDPGAEPAAGATPPRLPIRSPPPDRRIYQTSAGHESVRRSRRRDRPVETRRASCRPARGPRNRPAALLPSESERRDALSIELDYSPPKIYNYTI
jgi:hypothetical protein